MNGRRNTAIGLSVGAFVALIALHGKPFFDALLGVPKVIQAFSTTLPLGTGSFFVSLVLAMGVWAMAVRHLPEPLDRGWGKDFYAEFMALATGIGTMLLQSLGQEGADVLQALLMGAMAGFFGPWVGKGAVSLKGMAFVTVEEPHNDQNGPEAGDQPLAGPDGIQGPAPGGRGPDGHVPVQVHGDALGNQGGQAYPYRDRGDGVPPDPDH